MSLEIKFKKKKKPEALVWTMLKLHIIALTNYLHYFRWQTNPMHNPY